MVAAGQADIAIIYQPSLLFNVDRGLPIIRFATLINKPLGCFVSLNLGSLSNLKGKKIGYSGTEVEKIILATMLKSVGLKLTDVQLINVKFNYLKFTGFISIECPRTYYGY